MFRASTWPWMSALILSTLLGFGCASTSAPPPVELRLLDGAQMQEGDVATAPEVIERVFPEWPAELRERGIQGVVVVDGVVGLDGRFRIEKTVRADHEALVPLLVDAVSKMRFKPATLNGEPVEVYWQLTQNFSFR